MGKRKSKTPKRSPIAAQKHELPLEKLRIEADFLKYMKLLKMFAKKYCVMIAVCDTPVGPAITQEMTNVLMDIGLKIDLYGKYRCAYAAMIDAGQAVFEKLSSDTVETKITIGNSEIELVSAGFSTGEKKGLIWIDGKNYSLNRRGLNIVLYDKTSKTVLDTVTFDTYAPAVPHYSPYMNMQGLKEFIKTHPNVTLVCTRFPAFPANAVTPGERFIRKKRLEYSTILRNVHLSVFTLNKYFDEAGITEVLGTPKSYFDLNGIRRFEDVHGKYVNISGGHRETAYQPERSQRTIFLMGGCSTFGIGSDDSRTVASYLQKQCNRHVPDAGIKVQNYGYFLAGDDVQSGEYSKLLGSLPVKPGDIVIYQPDCIWNGIWNSQDFLCIDLSHTADQPRNYEVFFDIKSHYTPDGYRLIAEGLFKELMDLGLLHPTQQSAGEQSQAVFGNRPGSDLRCTRDFADYLRLLKKYAQRYCVLVSSWDTPSESGFTEEISGLFRAVGFQANFTKKPHCSYAAIIDSGELAYEELCEDAAQYIDVTLTDDASGFQANIVSMGHNPEQSEKIPIEINGNIYSSKRRGLHFVVYDKAEQVAIDAVNFDISLNSIPCCRYQEGLHTNLLDKTNAGTSVAVHQPALEAVKKEFPFEADTFKELAEYKQALIDWYKQTFSITIGTVVMNCNPFTLGHRFLIEKALTQCDFLIIFVVQEDKSQFPFEDRLQLVKEGVADLKNVAVFPSGKFVLSSLTFSEYFNKSELQDRIIDTSLDVTVFAREIAPCLHITKRFAGEEPFDTVTRQYNETMRRILPEYGIEFIEVPRKTDVCGGDIISASRVRDLLDKRDFAAIRPLVPESTFHYLKSL